MIDKFEILLALHTVVRTIEDGYITLTGGNQQSRFWDSGSLLTNLQFGP